MMGPAPGISMKLTVLGCSGGIGGAQARTTAFLIDDDVLIDCGTGVGELELDALARLDHVFLTHAHLDHIAALPLLIDSVGDLRSTPITIHASPETLHILRTHVFNWLIWPDFSVLPAPERPYLRLEPLAVGESLALDGRRFTAHPALHTVPAVSYCIDSGSGQLFYSGDTATCAAQVAAINRQPALRHLIVETAFPDAQRDLAAASRHLCPATLGEMLAALEVSPEVHVSHLKPGVGELIMEEIGAAAGRFAPRALRQGQVLEF